MADFDYDLFVIGGGSGGVRAARIASQHGARVGIAEEYRYGGTCVIRGCVPKKLFVYASHFHDDFEDAAGFGWTVGESRFDWKKLISNKDAEIDRLNNIYIANLERAGVTLYHCRAELTGPHDIKLVGEDRTVSAKYILIATGGRPNLPDLSRVDQAITSNEAFHLDNLPDEIAVAGGGYIAVEFAGIFNGLGVKTHLIYRRDKILRGFDEDVRDLVSNEMRKKGIQIHLDTVVEKFEGERGDLKVFLTNGNTLNVGEFMFAIGRSPYTEGLGLEKAGVETGSGGEIRVDGYSKSNIDHIYAVGDVTDRVALTPVAIREGHAFADTVFGGKDIRVDHKNIATAVFSQPEIGTIGLTEAEARESYSSVDIYKSTFRAMKHTLSGRDEKMLMKIIVDGETDKVLGVHIVGPDAGEMVQLLGIAVKIGATKADFDATMAVHPTAAEELVTMREKWTG